MSLESGSPATVRNRIAVFIDADNISQARLSQVFNFLQPIWIPFIRRAYGVGLSEKRPFFQQSGVDLFEVPENIPRKNAADIALVVDVMEQLCLGIADAFAIVASDSDYTRLASKIRERGKPVFVFGEENTPLVLRNACDEFIVLDARTPPPAPSQNPVVKSAAKPAPKPAQKAPPKIAANPAPKPAAKPVQKTAKKAAAKIAAQPAPKLKQKPPAKPTPKPSPAIQSSPDSRPLSSFNPAGPDLPIDDRLVRELHRLHGILVERSIEPTLHTLQKLCLEEYPQFSPRVYWSADHKANQAFRVQNFTELIRKSKAFDLVRIRNGQGPISNGPGPISDYRLSLKPNQSQIPSAPASSSSNSSA
jgi:hypothetical protein